jgi:hypothetical protein
LIKASIELAAPLMPFSGSGASDIGAHVGGHCTARQVVQVRLPAVHAVRDVPLRKRVEGPIMAMAPQNPGSVK